MLNNLKHFLAVGQQNLKGWSTNRKIVVIESDDWGSMRMPSIQVYNSLLESRICVDQCPYNRFDSLATEEDLDLLFSTLSKFRDKNGNHPVITANCIMGNPDFERIKASGFTEYYFEFFTETLKRTKNCLGSFEIWKQGINDGLFFSQFHGREHLNVNRWMNALRVNSIETRHAFDHRIFGISTNITTEKRKSYLAALDFDNISEIEMHGNILKDGLAIFEKIFGYRSASFIAANYIWHHQLEKPLAEYGVKFIQGAKIQFEPQGNNLPYKQIKHYLGEKNQNNQTFLVRNCSFEPSIQSGINVLNNCLNEIALAFLLKKPAVISIHRLNFIGALSSENRNRNIKLFEVLLSKILKKYPDVEFMNSEQLGNLIVFKY